MKKTMAKWITFLILMFFVLLWNGCGSVKKNRSIVIKDSTIYREYNVPIKIKETTINRQLSMDSLCAELEAIKSELRRTKSKGTTIIYRDTNRGLLEARLDSLGNFLLLAQIKAIDTLIRGQETINVKTKEKKNIIEKERSNWLLWLIIGVLISLIAPYLIKFLIKSIKPL